MPSHARKARISRSQQSLANVAVTVWPESHLISKPSEHQRVLLAWTATVPLCGLLERGRLGAFGRSKPLPAITR